MLDKLNTFKDTFFKEKEDTFKGRLLCKLTGVSYDGRQENIEKINEDTSLRLVRDRNNSFDFYAVMVEGLIDGEWKELGFIPKELNKKIALSIDKGEVDVRLFRKIGGGEEDYLYGLTVSVENV